MWIELQIEVPAEAAELVAAAAGEVAAGVELRDAGTLLPADPGRTVVVALCAPGEAERLLAEVDETCARARRAGGPVDPVTVRRREAHEEEWRDVWKQFFRATPVGRRFVVRPSWDRSPVDAGARIIDLDPGRAFGTGGHPSTRMAVELCERRFADGLAVHRFLDLGCGSGILSIAAALLWPAARGIAVDVDPEAVACAGENLERNRIGAVETAGTIGQAPGPFDLVLANIQASVLLDLAEEVHARLGPGADVVLSGLLTEEAAAVAARYARTGLTLRQRRDEGEWAALRLRQETSAPRSRRGAGRAPAERSA